MKQYVVSNGYREVSNVIDMINHNCDIDGIPAIPLKICMNSFGEWCLEALHPDDEEQLEKQLDYIFNMP